MYSSSPSFLHRPGYLLRLTTTTAAASARTPTNLHNRHHFLFLINKKKKSTTSGLWFSDTGRPSRSLLRSIHPSSSAMAEPTTATKGEEDALSMKLLFVEMGVGYDQHGQNITAAAVRACRDAISSNSIPAFRRGSIPGVNSDEMKLVIKLGVPRAAQHLLDIARVKAVFPYGQIINVDVVDGGMICSSGVYLEAMGDKNDDCYIVNAAVYVGY